MKENTIIFPMVAYNTLYIILLYVHNKLQIYVNKPIHFGNLYRPIRLLLILKINYFVTQSVDKFVLSLSRTYVTNLP